MSFPGVFAKELDMVSQKNVSKLINLFYSALCPGLVDQYLQNTILSVLLLSFAGQILLQLWGTVFFLRGYIILSGGEVSASPLSKDGRKWATSLAFRRF
jgi:hypothetical protein